MSAIHPISILETSSDATRRMRVLAWPIDPGNPYTAALYSQMEQDVLIEAFHPGRLLHRYDVWHLHWPESLLNIRNAPLAAFKLSSFLAIIDLIRLRGGKIIWTVHNLGAHDALHPTLEGMFWRHFISRVDGVISLSKRGLILAGQKFPRLRVLPATVIPHGHYRDQYPPCRVDARAALGIPEDARVFLFFGEVREYKNVDALIRAFRNLKLSNVVLYVVGRPWSASLTETIRREAAQDRRVHLELEFIQRGQVAKYLDASNLVVLPYRQILNSGAALLALSLNRPVLVPDQGSMGDLKEDFGGDWVRTFSRDLDSGELEQALDWASLPKPSVCPIPDKYQWQNIRSETARFYREVIDTQPAL